MKITDFVIIFIIIIFPIFFYLEMKAEKTQTFAEINHQHEGAMTVAAQDAVNVLRTNVQPKLEAGYLSYKINPADPQPSLDTFLQSLATHYRVKDRITMDVMSRYVPVYAVIEYDGLLINVYKEIMNNQGEKELRRVWLPKIPFSYVDNEGNVINFTIDKDVEVFDASLQEWYEGKRDQLPTDVTIPLLQDGVQFDQIRRQTIVNTLQDNFAFYINEHNVYTKQLDVTYKFALPLIPEEDWYNTVDDISIFAFFQGYPYRYEESTFHEYAFVGTRLMKKETIVAGVVNEEKRFWYKSCNFSYTAEEIFSNKKEAAKAGYRELSCLNPL